METNERQKRRDSRTANVVIRGVNILAVRGRPVARHYMEFHGVAPEVIARVLDQPALRRKPNAEQLVSEAIVPLPGKSHED